MSQSLLVVRSKARRGVETVRPSQSETAMGIASRALTVLTAVTVREAMKTPHLAAECREWRHRRHQEPSKKITPRIKDFIVLLVYY
ncbi:unnamed protein product [Parnassius apollo]|uniref:(apollo) hypothetical protein n=1 Tax=Parnassius apollo TaxID=110799 RepID=A0A8S3XXX9_PARAO|nr:unnamed protein product [Parnassius apollo]